VDDGTDAERQANSAIAHVIGNFMRGTNFRAAAPLHAIQHSGESDHR
jgi:hypothetical protein